MARRDVRFARKIETSGFSGDHGGLAGLADDDHTQYHTDARALTWLGSQNVSVLTNDAGYLTSVAVSDLDNGTDGELITWDSSGVATTVAVGTAGHVLTSNGPGAAPTFQAAGGGSSLTNFQDNGLIGEALYDGDVAFQTATDGIAVTGGSGTDPHVRLYDTAGGTVQGQFVHSGDILLFDNRIASGTVRMRGVNAASATSNIIIGDPDADCALYYNGTNTFKTSSLGISIESATGSDGEIRFNENSVLTSRIFYDTSLGIWKYRMQTAGDTFRIEEGNGVNVSAEFTPDAGIELYYAGDPTLYVQSGGIRVRGQSTSADVEFADSADTQRGRLVATSSSFSFGASTNSATVSMTSLSSAGAARFVFLGDPDGDSTMYRLGTAAILTQSLGAAIRDVAGDDPLLKLQSNAGTDAGWLYFGSTGTGGYLRSFQEGMNFRHMTEDAGGTAITHIELDPDLPGIGFNASTPIAKPTVTGSRGGNAALASLLTALANYGLITDSST